MIVICYEILLIRLTVVMHILQSVVIFTLPKGISNRGIGEETQV